jgi:hypothetical protein
VLSADVVFYSSVGQKIGHSTFRDTGITHITVDENNSHFRVVWKMLLDSRCRTVIFYFRDCDDVVIPHFIAEIADCNFEGRGSMSPLTFEPKSHLHQKGRRAFRFCLGIQSVCIPASVEIIWGDCSNLATLTFEPSLRVRLCKNKPFAGCSWLRTFTIPHSVELVWGGLRELQLHFNIEFRNSIQTAEL